MALSKMKMNKCNAFKHDVDEQEFAGNQCKQYHATYESLGGEG